MNNGKVCIAICSDTVSELLANARKAASVSDIAELRLDCLRSDELRKVSFSPDADLIVTFRPTEQGGFRDLSLEDRHRFWTSIKNDVGADLEEDVFPFLKNTELKPKICSFHDFSDNIPNVNAIYDRLAATSADVIKIAVKANDIVDAIDLWKLLERAKSEGRQFIPIAMGEAGKWTRILGLAHGAFLTYTALETGGEVAPGQISVRDMLDVFRVKELDERSDVYGIIAGNTSYTMSPYVHNAAFKAAGINSVFVPLQVADLEAFIRRMVKRETREIELNFRGFSVTNPHKQSIIRYLDHVDDAAEKIGAVNTVKIIDSKLHGYNTDAGGFIKPLKARFGDLKNARVAIAGAGGAARACAYALVNEGANVKVMARDPKKAELLGGDFNIRAGSLQNDLSDYDIVVNATPLGTKGENANNTIATSDHLRNVKLVYDLVYNPAETRLLREAKESGADTLNGFDMFIAQALNQFKIWTGLDASADVISAAARKRLNES